MAQVISIEKSVQHNNGDSWELENYPPFAQKDNAEEWLGVSEISLERAKELAFQLAGNEAYDYEDEINDAEDLYELQDVLDNFKYYQRDNTYNSSWWGGVVDFGVLTEDGEGYGTGLVLLRMHRGGDPRGNYYDMRAFELDSFIEEFPPYLSRLTYYIKTDEGDLTLDTEDMEGYSLMVVEDETGTFEQDDYVKIDEVEDAFDMNGNSFFSFGGGVAVGSLIGAYIGYKVGRARGKRKGGTFDTEKKIYRNVKKKFAGGGGVYSHSEEVGATYVVTHYLSFGMPIMYRFDSLDKAQKQYNRLVNNTKEDIKNDKNSTTLITLDGYVGDEEWETIKEFDVDDNTYAKGGGVFKFPIALKRTIDEINELFFKVKDADEIAGGYFGSTHYSYVELEKPIEIKDNYVYIFGKNGRYNYSFEKRYNVNKKGDEIDGLSSLKYDLSIIKKAFKSLLKNSYAGGGGVEKNNGRYQIKGASHYDSKLDDVLYYSTNNKNEIGKLVERALGESHNRRFGDSKSVTHIYVYDTINDEEVYNYAKGGGVEEDIYYGVVDHNNNLVFQSQNEREAKLVSFSYSGSIVKKYKGKGKIHKYAVGGNVQSEITNINNRIYNLNELRSVSSNKDDIAYLTQQINGLEREKENLLNPKPIERKKLFGLFGEGGGVDGDELPYPYQMQWENLLRDFGTHYVMMMFPSGANGYYISRTKGNYSDDAIRQSLKSMNSSKLSQGGGIDDLIKG